NASCALTIIAAPASRGVEPLACATVTSTARRSRATRAASSGTQSATALRPAADVLDRSENAFIGRRGVEPRRKLVGANAANGIPQPLERRQRQHQRRLADGLRPIDGFFAIRLSKEIDVKVRGHIVRGRNLVGGRRVGLQFTLVVPPQLFHRKP